MVDATISGERWSIYIDIEGFGILWDKEDQVLLSLGELMRAVFRIGCECYPDSPERIFAHQTGDGFVIVSDFHEESLERAITIAAALLRFVAKSGRLAKAAIAEGQLSDIHGCYPEEVTDHKQGDNRVSLHGGIMTLFPVMGTALIRAVAIAKNSPKGPLLIIETKRLARITSNVPATHIDQGLSSIDWVHINTPLLREIEGKARLMPLPTEKLEKFLASYCKSHTPPEKWVANVKHLLGVQKESAA